jgi:hypothetical protein
VEKSSPRKDKVSESKWETKARGGICGNFGAAQAQAHRVHVTEIKLIQRSSPLFFLLSRVPLHTFLPLLPFFLIAGNNTCLNEFGFTPPGSLTTRFRTHTHHLLSNLTGR